MEDETMDLAYRPGDHIATSLDWDSHVNNGNPWVWLMATAVDNFGYIQDEAWLHLTADESVRLGNRLIALGSYLKERDGS